MAGPENLFPKSKFDKIKLNFFNRDRILSTDPTQYQKVFWYKQESSPGNPEFLNRLRNFQRVDATHFATYHPPTVWPKGILRMPKMYLFLYGSPTSFGTLATRGIAWKNQFDLIKNQLETWYTDDIDIRFASLTLAQGDTAGVFAPAAPAGSTNLGAWSVNKVDLISNLTPYGKPVETPVPGGGFSGDDPDDFIGVDFLCQIVWTAQGGSNYGVGSDVPSFARFGMDTSGPTNLQNAYDYLKKCYPGFAKYKVMMYFDSDGPMGTGLLNPDLSEKWEGNIVTWYATPTLDTSGSSITRDGFTGLLRNATAYVIDNHHAPIEWQFFADTPELPSFWIHTTSVTDVYGSLAAFDQNLLAQIGSDMADYGFEYKGTVGGGTGPFIDHIKAHWNIKG